MDRSASITRSDPPASSFPNKLEICLPLPTYSPFSFLRSLILLQRKYRELNPAKSESFIPYKPRKEDYWRGIVLYGRNVSSYKFALAKSLLSPRPEAGPILRLDDLAALCKILTHSKTTRIDSGVFGNMSTGLNSWKYRFCGWSGVSWSGKVPSFLGICLFQKFAADSTSLWMRLGCGFASEMTEFAQPRAVEIIKIESQQGF